MRSFISAAALISILITGIQITSAEEHTELMTEGPRDFDSAAGPSILFPQENFHFGVVSQGDTLEHTFIFQNTGTEPLLIEKLTAS